MKTPDGFSFIPLHQHTYYQHQARTFSLKAGGFSDCRGVTLMELLTVLAILAVLAGIGGIGILRGMPERRLMSASRELYCALRQAQAQAVARGERVAVTFSPEADEFSMTDSAGNLLSRIKLPGYIDLYEITGDGKTENQYFFNSLGIKTGVSGSVCLRYQKPGYDLRRVQVRSTGSMVIQRSSDNGKTWV
ncbi:MAG: GspH/FimT family pseudopilin [Thermodesulfobacteriota bacterium]